MGGKLRLILPGVSFGMFGLSGVFAIWVSMYYNHNKFYLYFSGISLAVTSLLYFFFIETPFYHFKQRRVRKLYQCLLDIASWNHSKDEFPLVASRLRRELRLGEFFESSDAEEGEPLSTPGDPGRPPSKGPLAFLELFKLGNLSTFLKLTFILLNIEIIFGLSIIINKDLGIADVFLSGILVSAFQILGYGLGGFLTSRWGRRTINLATSSLALLLSASLVLLDLTSNRFFSFSTRPEAVRVAESGRAD